MTPAQRWVPVVAALVGVGAGQAAWMELTSRAHESLGDDAWDALLASPEAAILLTVSGTGLVFGSALLLGWVASVLLRRPDFARATKPLGEAVSVTEDETPRPGDRRSLH